MKYNYISYLQRQRSWSSSDIEGLIDYIQKKENRDYIEKECDKVDLSTLSQAEVKDVVKGLKEMYVNIPTVAVSFIVNSYKPIKAYESYVSDVYSHYSETVSDVLDSFKTYFEFTKARKIKDYIGGIENEYYL